MINLSVPLLAALITINVTTVVCMLFSQRRRKPATQARSAGSRPAGAEAKVEETPAPQPALDPSLQSLIDEVENSAARAQRPVGEVGLEESLARWRRSGKNGSAVADSCRLQHTA